MTIGVGGPKIIKNCVTSFMDDLLRKLNCRCLIFYRAQCFRWGIMMMISVPSSSGVNFINVLWAAITRADPKSAKKTENLTIFFCTFGICTRKKLLVECWWNRPHIRTSQCSGLIGRDSAWAICQIVCLSDVIRIKWMKNMRLIIADWARPQMMEKFHTSSWICHTWLGKFTHAHMRS